MVKLRGSLPDNLNFVLTVTRILPANAPSSGAMTLALTASERTRSRHRFRTEEGTEVGLNLPRGTVLRDGDLLVGEEQILVRVIAKPEPVILVTSEAYFRLIKAAYHLGNRHVSLEMTPTHLKLAPDPVLEAMLAQLGGLSLQAATLPFEPESGAYRQGAGHSHD